MSRQDAADTYVAENVYHTNEPAHFVADLNTKYARSFVRILNPEDIGYDATVFNGLRAVYIAAAGTITIVDQNDNIETDVPVLAGLVLVVAFKNIYSISAGCIVYKMGD